MLALGIPQGFLFLIPSLDYRYNKGQPLKHRNCKLTFQQNGDYRLPLEKITTKEL